MLFPPPKTNIGIDYEVNNRSGLYDLTSSRITLGYAWKQNSSIEHSFTPVSVNLVKAQNISEDFFMDVLRSDNPDAILRALDNTIIMSSNYVINYTPSLRKNAKHTFSLTGGVEVAGNLASLLSRRVDLAGTQTLFDVTIAQYVRFDADVRYAYDLNKTLKIANRFLVGYGIPYGNSSTLPFVKQYTSGGNNSIRAFPARAIGPGSYAANSVINSQFLGSQTGDIKLELNTELRIKFNKYLNGAFFIDAGNVWLQKSNAYEEGAIFKSDFIKQVAIGTGIGLRLDFSVLVLRFDLATPVRKPFLPEEERWVLKNFNLKDANWRSENLVLNIAVGYPF